MLRHERKVVQRAQQAAIPGLTERDLLHPRAFIGDVLSGNADEGQPFAHGVRKHRAQLLRFAHWNDDRKSRPFADEEQVLTSADLEDVAVPVAKPRGGLDWRQAVDLFQPNEQLLCAPENDHQFVNLQYDIGGAQSRARRPARS